MTTASETVPPRPPMKNASRERRKAERIALAAQVAALQRTLHLLHADTASKRTRQCLELATNAWQSRAMDESRKRRLAEYTNHELRKARGRQEHKLRELLELLRDTKRHARTVPAWRLHDTSGRRFAILADEVERAYEDLDVVFASKPGRDDDEFATKLVQRKSRFQPDELVLEARRASTIYVDFARCCRAYGSARQQITQATHVDAWISQPHAGVVMMRLHAKERRMDQTWESTSSLVLKRFVEEDRVAIVWRSVTSVDNQTELDDVYVEEVGWTLLERVVAVDADSSETVRMQDCVHLVPRSTHVAKNGDPPSSVHPLTKTFTQYVMEATIAHMVDIKDLMESLLIDDCMTDDTDELSS